VFSIVSSPPFDKKLEGVEEDANNAKNAAKILQQVKKVLNQEGLYDNNSTAKY